MAGDLMPIIRPPNTERRGAAVRAEVQQRNADRQTLRGKGSAIDTISKGKGNASPAQTRDNLADLAELLKPLVNVV